MCEDDINASLYRLFLLFLYGKILFPLESNGMHFIYTGKYQHVFYFLCLQDQKERSDPGTISFGKDSFSLEVADIKWKEKLAVVCSCLVHKNKWLLLEQLMCPCMHPSDQTTAASGASQQAQVWVTQATHSFSSVSTERQYYTMALEKCSKWWRFPDINVKVNL